MFQWRLFIQAQPRFLFRILGLGQLSILLETSYARSRARCYELFRLSALKIYKLTSFMDFM